MQTTMSIAMTLKSAIVLAGCLSTVTATAAEQQKIPQSRFLHRNRRRHDVRRGAAINRKLTTKTSAQHELDITAEDIGFWTRTLQSSFPPAPNPTRAPRTPSPTEEQETYSPTDAVDRRTLSPTPNPTDGSPVTPNPTDGPDTPVPTPNPISSPTTPEPSPNPTDQFVPTPAPTTLAPTEVPTNSPTFPCNLTPEERATQIRVLLSTVSDDALFDDPASPQAQALEWITNEDEIQPVLCPNQIGAGCSRNGDFNPLVQRYVLAAFYFATEGETWTNCSEEGNCDRVVTPFGVANERVGDTSTANWLGPENECEWGGVACWGSDTPNLNMCLDQLDFGEYCFLEF